LATPDHGPADTSEPISLVISDPLPQEALDENVDGRRVTAVDDGFGKLWRKNYWIRLEGASVTPTELIDVWKRRYTEFWPKGSHLYQPADGLAAGDVAAADLAMIGGVRVGTGIFVLRVTDTSFTFATLEGHTFCGTITFSGVEERGATVARVSVVMRASDPIYELGMPLGGHHHENKFWEASLRALARYFEVETEPGMEMEVLDAKRQWRNARNVVHNAFLHTAFTVITRPIRRIVDRMRGRGLST
jgi:hypothetical protein